MVAVSEFLVGKGTLCCSLDQIEIANGKQQQCVLSDVQTIFKKQKNGLISLANSQAKINQSKLKFGEKD